jgi:predicted dehydrogenase
VNVAIVGCGNVAERYASRIAASEPLALVGVTDTIPERADRLAHTHGVTRFVSLPKLLDDDGVDTVVNLTAPGAHASVTAAALEAGKHVHTEKPIALRYDEARELVELAQRTGRRLSCSPATLLGEAQQTAWKLVREGALGQVRVVYAEANWGRIESWHPSPEALYEVGPLVDVGVYPLTILTAMFGPVRRVVAYGTTLEQERVTLSGKPFVLGAPDFVVALLELDGDVVARLTTTFWVRHGRQRGIEFHGSDGRSLHLASFQEFDARLEMSTDAGDTYQSVPLLREPFAGTDWARPIVELAEAIAAGRLHRASAEQAAHVVEVIEAIARSQADGGAVDVLSTFEPPRPMDWSL